MLEMLGDHSLKNKVFIILVVVHSAEQIFLLQCLQKTRTFILMGFDVNTFTFLCVYDMRILLLKLNGETLLT